MRNCANVFPHRKKWFLHVWLCTSSTTYSICFLHLKVQQLSSYLLLTDIVHPCPLQHADGCVQSTKISKDGDVFWNRFHPHHSFFVNIGKVLPPHREKKDYRRANYHYACVSWQRGIGCTMYKVQRRKDKELASLLVVVLDCMCLPLKFVTKFHGHLHC